MWRNTAKFSFSIIGPSDSKPQIQLPLLSYQEADHSLQFKHQIASLSFQTSKKIKLTKIQRIAQFIQEKQLRIDFQSKYLLLWNVLILLVVFTLFVEIPIVVFAPKGLYQELYYNTSYIVFYYLMVIILMIDMVMIRPRICYQIKGHRTQTSQEAIHYYIINNFRIDILSVVILIVSNLPFQNIDYLRLFFLVKIFSLKEIDRQIDLYLLASPFAKGVYSFIRLTSFIAFVTNLYACIYFAIDYHYYIKKDQFYDMGFLWLNGSSAVGQLDIFQTFGWGGSYIYALFWALQTSRTCGYGVATPKNTVEIFYVNFVILTLVVIFVYFANGVIKIVLEYSSSMRKKESAVFSLLKNIEHYQVSSKIRNKMKEYFSNYKNFQTEELENNIIGSLSEDLRNRYTFAFNMYFIDLISVFNLITPFQSSQQRLIKLQISKKIQKKSYDSKQIIFDTFSITQPSLILIQKGTVVIQNKSINYRRIQQQWSIIGQRQFYYDKLPIYQAFTTEYSEISYVNRKDFQQIIKRYRSFYEKLRQTMDKIILGKKDTTSLQTKCIFCDESHLQQFCPSYNRWRYDIKYKKPKKLDNLCDHQRQPKTRRSIKNSRTILLHKQDIRIDQIRQAISYNNHFNL